MGLSGLQSLTILSRSTSTKSLPDVDNCGEIWGIHLHCCKQCHVHQVVQTDGSIMQVVIARQRRSTSINPFVFLLVISQEGKIYIQTPEHVTHVELLLTG